MNKIIGARTSFRNINTYANIGMTLEADLKDSNDYYFTDRHFSSQFFGRLSSIYSSKFDLGYSFYKMEKEN